MQADNQVVENDGVLPDPEDFLEVLPEDLLEVLPKDLLENREAETGIPLAHATSGTIKTNCKPNTRVPLNLPCPGINCILDGEYQWSCKKCRARIEWGFDQHVYCNCGKTPTICMEFNCSQSNHCDGFKRHEKYYLKEELSKIQPLKEINILILGETGVGKSTFINAFVNFVSYDTLEAAAAHDLINLIPSKFTVYDENFEEILVETGMDENETYSPGQSATQCSKVYTFHVNNTTIRLIDTPGIGDTRGIDQDKLNFKNILATLDGLDELHGICILLKPNNARVNVMFRFCIKELLTHLHRDASKNIVFCFTNSRGTFYRPGDTMPALKTLLAENQEVEITLSKQTVYCFDSEAYRFLAAIKNNPPVNFPAEEKENFSKSWEKSISETDRMLNYIRSLTPHPIKSTINLNHARELVLKLSRPLAEISRNIQTNLILVDEEKHRIEKTEANIAELKKNLITTRTEIETVKINYPKTVCSNSKCVKIWSVGTRTGLKTTEYVQVCHNHCNLAGIAHDTIGDPGLMKCWAMQNGNCRHTSCGHSYREHLHVYYESKQVPKRVEDQSVKEALKKDLNATEMKKRMIESKNKLIDEYKDELKKIQECSVRFAYFLKTNAITPYNDGMEQYLDHLIREERDKIAAGGSRGTFEALRRSKDSYIEERRVLEEAMKKGEGNSFGLSPQDMGSMVTELKSLKHSGQSLKDALDCVKRNAFHVHQDSHVSFIATRGSRKNSRQIWDDGIRESFGGMLKNVKMNAVKVWEEVRNKF